MPIFSNSSNSSDKINSKDDTSSSGSSHSDYGRNKNKQKTRIIKKDAAEEKSEEFNVGNLFLFILLDFEQPCE
jgi:hypothetical protein